MRGKSESNVGSWWGWGRQEERRCSPHLASLEHSAVSRPALTCGTAPATHFSNGCGWDAAAVLRTSQASPVALRS